MRALPLFTCCLFIWGQAMAHAQSFELHGAAGPTLTDRGYSLAAGAGWTPGSRLTVSLNLERSHLVSQEHTAGGGVISTFRGGTLTIGTAEVRVALLGRERLTPYLLAGYAAGTSRPTVNATFPTRIANDVRGVFAGAGMHLPLGPRVAVFADARLLLGDEAGELLALAPLRVGLSVRF